MPKPRKSDLIPKRRALPTKRGGRAAETRESIEEREMDALLSEIPRRPFATDTLYPTAGGPPHNLDIRKYDEFDLDEEGRMPAGRYWYGPELLSVNVGSDYFREQPSHVLSHEVGHMAEGRGLYPDARALVRASFPRQQATDPEAYAATSPQEQWAEGFANATTAARIGNIGHGGGDGDEAWEGGRTLGRMRDKLRHPHVAVGSDVILNALLDSPQGQRNYPAPAQARRAELDLRRRYREPMRGPTPY